MWIYFSIYHKKLKWVKKANYSSLYKLPVKRIIKRETVSVVQKSCSAQLIAAVQAVQYGQFFIMASAAITKKSNEEFRRHYFLITQRRGLFAPSFKDACKQSLLFPSWLCEYDVVLQYSSQWIYYETSSLIPCPAPAVLLGLPWPSDGTWGVCLSYAADLKSYFCS